MLGMLLIQFNYIIIFFLSVLFAKIVERTFFSALTLFTLIWSMFPFFSTLGILGLNKPHNLVHLYILMGNISFILVYILTILCYRKKLVVSNYIMVDDIVPTRYHTLIFLNTLLLIILIPYAIDSVNLASIYGYQFLRERASFALTQNVIVQVCYNWFVVPLFLASACIGISGMLNNNRKINVFLLVIVMCNVILHSFIFAARALIVKLICYVIFGVLFVKKDEKGRVNRTLCIFVLIMLAITVFITAKRMYDAGYTSFNFFDSVFMYYLGGFSLLDYYFQKPEQFALFDTTKYLHGKAIFGFILNIYDAVMYVIVNKDYQGSDYIIAKATESFYPIGTDLHANSITTCIYPFFRDFGELGLVLGFSFMAFTISYVYIQMISKRCQKFQAMYIYLLYILFKSILNYEPISPDVFFTVVLIYVFSPHTRRYINA